MTSDDEVSACVQERRTTGAAEGVLDQDKTRGPSLGDERGALGEDGAPDASSCTTAIGNRRAASPGFLAYEAMSAEQRVAYDQRQGITRSDRARIDSLLERDSECGACVERIDADIVDEGGHFFAPVDSDLVDGLIGQYQDGRKRIDAVGTFVNDVLNQGVIGYFLDGNCTPDRGRSSMSWSAQQLFEVSGAVKALNSAYWSKALALTDVLDTMPQKRRDEWNKAITEQTTPDFSEDTVRSTMSELLRMRTQFFSERVDGIFRGLSGEHVTNAPEAFGKRMIIARVLSCYAYAEHSTCGLINDLRCVIAKFMGRDEPKYYASSALVEALKGNWGQWVSVDGGALRIRLYKKGTAHLEVHPDMAWRLNQVLAHLHPLAIPASFRKKPKKRAKDYVVMGRPLPFKVLELLADMRQATRRREPAWPERYEGIPNSAEFRYSGSRTSCLVAEAEMVLRAIGGSKTKEGWFEFDYAPLPIIQAIVVSGCIPDQKAHQFYPTPEKLARIAADLAEIGETDEVVEPSAGQGGIADHLPKDRTTCVEISALHCAVLKAKGLKTVEADFLKWAQTAPKVDVVVMNPPFSDGRAEAHTLAASTMVRSLGRLVSILPASMRGRDFLGAGWVQSWSSVYEREFAGTDTAVVILKATRTAAPTGRTDQAKGHG